MYSITDTTKDKVVSYINQVNQTKFTRQAFEYKEDNIPIEFCLRIFNRIKNYYDLNCINDCPNKMLLIEYNALQNSQGNLMIKRICGYTFTTLIMVA